MLLKNLSTSLITSDLVAELHSLGISTTTDLIFSSATPLQIYSRMSSKSMSFADFESSIQSIIASLAGSGQDASMLSELTKSDFKMQTSTSLDDHLGGGLPCARVIEISGDRGSGKSILLLNWVLTSLLRTPEMAVLWIDTTGDFAIDRAVRILEHHQQTLDDMEVMLQRLHISTAIDLESVQQIIRALGLQLAQASEPRIKCVVIDSVTSLLGPYLSAVSSQGHAIMAAFMRYLHDLAKSYSLLILIVNNATLMRIQSTRKPQTSLDVVSNPHSAFASTIRKPALGPSFPFMTDATLWVARLPVKEEDGEGSTAHVIEVFRSRFSVSHVWTMFRIAASGALLTESTNMV
ncbi:P-loop containing nucleoside triphosphate hydrolase protein [Lentinula raphanica]|nr:P-loop containing nucleoside triphosphate hydrolase protein [Lentinula raphanica]